MRKLFGKKDDVGAIGIGAMIVFIAMILVAGVAASVLVSTSNTVQSQAMTTGSQTTREVSSGLTVFSVLGEVNRTGNDSAGYTYNGIWRLAVTVSTKPGSGKIDLNNTYILISDGNKKALLTYAGFNNSSYWDNSVAGDVFDNADLDWTTGDTTWGNDEFGIGVLQDYDGSMSQNNPVLNRGDKAILYIRTNVSSVFSSQIGTRTEIFGRVIPEIGAPGVISFTSPKAYVDTVYTLQ
jgi:flagellin FlaB